MHYLPLKLPLGMSFPFTCSDGESFTQTGIVEGMLLLVQHILVQSSEHNVEKCVSHLYSLFKCRAAAAWRHQTLHPQSLNGFLSITAGLSGGGRMGHINSYTKNVHSPA